MFTLWMERWQDTQSASVPSQVSWFEFPLWWGRGWTNVAVCVCVVLHLIRECFKFRMGHPLDRCAADGHSFRNLSWSKEQLAFYPTPCCASLNLISLISVFVWVRVCVCVYSEKSTSGQLSHTEWPYIQTGCHLFFKVKVHIHSWSCKSCDKTISTALRIW